MTRITTSEIAPSPFLEPFVRCYSYREFDTKGMDLVKPWHASHETMLLFFFKDLLVKAVNTYTGRIVDRGSYGCICGTGTQFNGEQTYNGSYSFFTIDFKLNGFNKIFGIPSNEITNQIIFTEDIFDSRVIQFYEQLYLTKDLTEMASLTDNYLLCYLKKQKDIHASDSITCTSNLILRNPGLLNIEQLAHHANMSVRNFERKFSQQVGLSPKLFCSIARFNHALALKLKCPRKDWLTVALECGYFDQTHLIKDFKKFAGNSPSVFMKKTPLAAENFTSRVEI
jgi:AraC-like DNA-binding protein